MKYISCFVVFLGIVFIGNLYSDGISIEFPPETSMVIGVSLKSEDTAFMELHSREQAAVIYTRLKGSHNRYDYISIDDVGRKKETSVVTDLEDMYGNLDALQIVTTHSFGGYEIYFYDMQKDIFPKITSPADVEFDIHETMTMDGDNVTAVVTEWAITLTDALETALSKALLGMARTSKLHSVTKLESGGMITVRDILLVSETDLHDIRLHKLEIERLYEGNYQSFKVQMELHNTPDIRE